jgi:hypothetical protein
MTKIQVTYPNGYTALIVRSQITYPFTNTFDVVLLRNDCFVDDEDTVRIEDNPMPGMRSNFLCYRNIAETNQILNKIKNLPPI